MSSEAVTLTLGDATVEGDLVLPDQARGVVVFAHGSGSSRHSPRNRAVAGALNDAGFGTLLLDLLTVEEETADAETAALRFDIGLLARRLVGAIDRLAETDRTAPMPIGVFGASTGAAAALVAAAERPDRVVTVVSRGGRPDLAGDALERVTTPVLLIVGARDREVLRLNEEAAHRLRAAYRLELVPNATHLFEEPGTLDHVAALSAKWFEQHLTRRRASGG